MSGSLPVIPGYVLISAIGRGAYGDVLPCDSSYPYDDERRSLSFHRE
jgi:hypothetical protein